jgi:magnesium-transporting ATPase (P-type)
MIKEEQIKSVIKNRSRAKKLELLISRIVLFILNIAVMGGCWVAIYCVNAYQIDIATYMKSKYSWLKSVGDFIAPVCLSVINLVLPIITNIIISLERWDYKSTIINN